MECFPCCDYDCDCYLPHKKMQEIYYAISVSNVQDGLKVHSHKQTESCTFNTQIGYFIALLSKYKHISI